MDKLLGMWVQAENGEVALKDSGQGKSFQWAELQAVYLIVSSVWKKWPEVKVFTVPRQWSLAWLSGQWPERNKNLEDWNTKVWGRDILCK